LWIKAKFPAVEVEVIEDVFSDVVLDFYENIRRGKYSKQAALKTYLFTMGRNKIINIVKKRSMHGSKEPEIITDVERRSTINPIAVQQKNEQHEVVKAMMNELCDDCQKVLTKFYYHRMSMDEIAQEMGYKNANVAKSKKNVCYKKIRKLIQERFSKADFF
jgi:RNA polymerase sigma factor (sigma-70 family)